MSQKDCNNANDRVLWKEFKEGSTQAYTAIMNNYYHLLYNYGSRFTPNSELLKDDLQELFLGLWKNRETINDTLSVKHYLLKSLRRRLYRTLSKTKPTLQFDELHFESGFDAALSVENDIILEENLKEICYKIRGVLQQLSRRQQEIIYLRFYMDADVNEISEIMDLSRQSVYNLLHEAFKRFKSIADLNYFSVSLQVLLLVVLTQF
jgi:RNA polymerase sigma factor (sigma-70 family)